MFDAHSCVVFRHRPQLGAHELWLADKIYPNDAALGLVRPFKKPQGDRFMPGEIGYNYWHRWYRATVEHTIGYIKRYGIMQHYRGNVLRRGVMDMKFWNNFLDPPCLPFCLDLPLSLYIYIYMISILRYSLSVV